MDRKAKKRIATITEKLRLTRLRLSGMKRQPAPGDDPAAVEREIQALEAELATLRDA